MKTCAVGRDLAASPVDRDDNNGIQSIIGFSLTIVGIHLAIPGSGSPRTKNNVALRKADVGGNEGRSGIPTCRHSRPHLEF